MKGKILSVLFCLLLVFGMILAACDNGDYPANPDQEKDGTPKADNKNTTLDFGGSPDDLTSPSASSAP